MVIDNPPADVERVWGVLREVSDPELPTLNIIDLGIVRNVELEDGGIHVSLTPTYSACPATDTIATDVSIALHKCWQCTVKVTTQLYPAWTTDWITAAGRRKLEQAGIVPPLTPARESVSPRDAHCPRCQSASTRLVSTFGSTPCKSTHVCDECLEPFEVFKCL